MVYHHKHDKVNNYSEGFEAVIDYQFNFHSFGILEILNYSNSLHLKAIQKEAQLVENDPVLLFSSLQSKSF